MFRARFVPKKSGASDEALAAFETSFDPNSKQGETIDRIVYRPLKGAALDIEGGPELTTREVVLCRAADNKCTYTFSDGSKAMVLCQIF